MANPQDIDRPGGWLVQVTIPGNPPLKQHYYAYELDKSKAVEMVEAEYSLGKGETCEAVKQLNVHELTGFGMRPGEIKQYV
jgi:hypothetical protein